MTSKEPKENPLQVFQLPHQVIKRAWVASRLSDAKPPDPQAERRRDAGRRWRQAMARGLRAAEAAEAVSVPRSTLYRWQQRPEHRSRRPHQLCQPRWSEALVEELAALRLDNPVWGKRKLGPILRDQGHAVSDSTVGRILALLVRRGQGRSRPRLPPPLASRQTYQTAPGPPSARRTPGQRPRPSRADRHPLDQPLARKDRQALHRPRPPIALVRRHGRIQRLFRFLDKLLASAPFPLRAVQVDGGSEFQGAFEDAARQRNVDLWVLPPASPQLNGRVERRLATWRYEFYQSYGNLLPHRIADLNPFIDASAFKYNHHRPHDALASLSPIQYLAYLSRRAPPPPSHMS